MSNHVDSASPLDITVRGDLVKNFLALRGMGAVVCEGKQINAVCDEIEWLRAKVDRLRRMIFTNSDRSMTMKGRTFTANENGFISDNNFDFDAGLQVSGDFVGDEKQQYAEMIAGALNAPNAGGNATERSEGRVDHNVGRRIPGKY